MIKLHLTRLALKTTFEFRSEIENKMDECCKQNNTTQKLNKA